MKKPNERTRPKKSKEKLEEKKKSGIPGLPFSSEIAELGKELKLSEHEVFLLVWLCAAMNEKTENKSCWKSEATLADEMRCSRQMITRAVNHLREKGLITVGKLGERKGFIQRNIYSINYPWPYISYDSHRVTSMLLPESWA